MSRIWTAILAFWLVVAGLGQARAQELTGLARFDPAGSRIVDLPRGKVEVELALSQGVPFRIFTLDSPRRLVMDFREVDWGEADFADVLASEAIAGARAGVYRPGLSRLVLDMSAPLALETAGLSVSDATGEAALLVRLVPTEPEEFARLAGAPRDPNWDLPPATEITPPKARGPDAPLRVVLDPGHGGIDPGAEHEGLAEKDLMLKLARELREDLLRAGGFEVALTRDGDHFVSLERRVAMAHEFGADVFLSLHADSLSEGLAHGATVYVLSREASDTASELLAQRHDRDEILSGVDLSSADDEVTDILLDLARQETQPRTEALAKALVSEMSQRGGPMNRRPLRLASFSVLKAADIPSVLLELGFLSSPRDFDNLQNREWRAKMVEGIRAGLQRWAREDAAQRSLIRQ